jgi:hypothetical protein
MAAPDLDIPVAAPRVLAAMEETHVNLRVTPNDNPLLAYSLAIPKTWAYSKQFGPVPSALLEPQGLGFFTASATPGAPVIAVTMTPVPFEIPLHTWARLAMADDGWTVLSARYLPGPYGLFFDLTGTRLVDDVEEVRRTTARIDGGKVFCVNTMCARVHWDDAKEIFWVAHATFELLGGTRQDKMEPWLAASAEAPGFRAAYPYSWRAEPASVPADQATSAVDIRLIDAEGKTLLAYLQVKAERALDGQQVPSLEQLEGAALSRLAGSGVAPTGPFRRLSEEEDPRATAVEGWLGGSVGEARLGEGDVAVRLGFVRLSDVTFSLSLLSPRLEDDRLAALRAERAFEIARFTLMLA